MAYYLNNASSGGAVVTIPEVEIGNFVGDYLEFKSFANSGNPGDEYRVLGKLSTFISLIAIKTDAIRVRLFSADIREVSTGYTQPAVGAEYIVRLEKTGASEWQVHLDGNLIGSFTDTGKLLIDQIGRFRTTATESYRGAFFYLAFSDNGGASVTRYYDPTASGGTGLTLTDTVSGLNGTLSGYPGDDSQWVFYTDVAGLTLTSITPTTGPAAGGTTVTMTGTGFEVGTVPKFNGVDATSVVIVSDTELTCVTPAL